MPEAAASATETAPLRSPFLTVLAAWLVPGAGHLMTGRLARAVIVFAAVIIAFVVGILMQGPMFSTGQSGDLLSKLIQYGGLVGDMASGLPYFVATWLGYSAPDRPTHTSDYGSKFLVAAGILNILAIVDAYEIATRQKD